MSNHSGANLMKLIDDAYPRFSKGQRLIAGFIREHYEKAAFMTASKLGATVGVSESTVVRFATEIGFDGYPQLQKSLQEMIRNRLTSVQRMEVTTQRLSNADVLTKVLQTDIDTIRRTMDEVDRQAFYQAVTQIIGARRIYIMGVRSAASLAGFMNFYFTHIFENVQLIEASATSAILERMMHAGPGDVFVGITFSRYSKRTYKAAAFAKENGASVIAITDSLAAPIAQVAERVLVAKSDMASFVDSLVAPLSLINALIVAISMERREEIQGTYERLEKIWDEYDVYAKSDGEPGKERE